MSHSTHNQHGENSRQVLISLIVDFILFLPDFVAACFANSITLWADVLKCFNELIATFLGWLAIRRVAQGKTPDYNYGQGKIENLAGIIVAFIMAVSIIIVLASAVTRIHQPEHVDTHGATAAAVLMTIGAAANTWLWIKNYRQWRKTHSPVMDSQWRLFRVKALSDGSVLVALLISLTLQRYGWAIYVDPAASFVIIGFLIFSAFGVVKSSVGDLMDRTLDESLQMTIVKRLAEHFDEYEHFHGLRSRRSGSDIFIDLFLEFAPDKPMGEVQRTIDNMKRHLEEDIEGSHVVIAPATSKVR